jgi:polyisoprenoid-binding protein YceI
MRFTTPRVTLTLAALLPALAGSSSRAPIEMQPESRLWIAGTSTVRSFQCQAASFEAKLESAGNTAVEALLAGDKALSSVVVTVPVEKLDCKNGTMNEHMRKALKAAQHPAVVFRVDAYELAKSADGVAVTLTGALTLGGVEKPVTVTARAKQGENGTLLVSGTHEVRMTEFGLKPPTLMLGTMKVDERVKVGFDIVLKD